MKKPIESIRILDVSQYMNRYKKGISTDNIMYRAYDDALLECAQSQIDDHANLVIEDLVWSSKSLCECKIKSEHGIVFMQEALLKTYPTKMLTKIVVRSMCKHLDIQRCLVSFSLQSTKLANDSQLMIYDMGIKKFIEWEPSDGLDYTVMVKCSCKNVEEDVAGRIVYKLGMKTDDRQRDVNRFIYSTQELIECGQKLGYDYIAQSTQYDESHKILICYVAYEAKFQDANIEIEDDLYHIAPVSTVEKILKFGISPKSKTFMNGEKVNHSDRVYLFNGFNKDAFNRFIVQLEKMSSHYDKLKKLLLQTKEYALLKVDKRKALGLKQYRDNNFQSKDIKHPTALYTYSNIPLNAIELVDYAHMH